MEEKLVSTILKQARLKQNINLSDLSTKTKIPTNILKHIENGAYTNTPAKVYLYGFVENLCEYFLLDEKIIIEKLKNEIKTNEKKEEKEALNTIINPEKTSLLEKVNWLKHKLQISFYFLTKDKKRRIITSSILVILIFIFLSTQSKNPTILEISENHKKNTYKMLQKTGTFDLKIKDSVEINHQEIKAIFNIQSVENDIIFIKINETEQNIYLKLNERFFVDINEDGQNDIELHLKEIIENSLKLQFNVLNYEAQELSYEEIWVTKKPITVGKNYTLLKYQKKTPIEIYLKAQRQPSYVSYNIDGKRQNSKNIKPGEDLNIDAEEHIEIQLGNYRSLIIMINKQPIDLTLENNTKFSITKIIKWLADPNNETKFNLIIKDYVN